MFVILYSNIEIKFASQVFLLFRFDFCIWIWIFGYKYSNFHVQIFQYSDSKSSNTRMLGFRFKYSRFKSNYFEFKKYTRIQIQIFEYPNSNIRIFEYSDWYSDIQDSDSQVMFITMSIFDIEVVILIVINSTNSDSPRSKFNSRPLYYVRRRVYTVWEASRLQDGPIDDFSRVINSYNEWYWERQRLPASNTRHSIGA